MAARRDGATSTGETTETASRHRDLASACLGPIASVFVVGFTGVVAVGVLTALLDRDPFWPVVIAGTVAVSLQFLVALGAVRDASAAFVHRRLLQEAQARETRARGRVAQLERATTLLRADLERLKRDRGEADAAAEAGAKARRQGAERMRGPLGALRRETEAIQADLRQRTGLQRVKRYVAVVADCIGVLGNTVDDLLDPPAGAGSGAGAGESGTTPAQRPEISLSEQIRSATTLIGPIAASRRVQLVPDLDRVPRAWVDPGVVRRIMVALLDNAARHAVEGGRVAVRLQRAESGDLRFEVTDTGPGMTAEAVRAALAPPRTDAGGVPLAAGGLSESAALAREHGMRVVVESEPGQGTRAVLVLPASLVADPLVQPLPATGTG
jgi:signal transduction histidine kinase